MYAILKIISTVACYAVAEKVYLDVSLAHRLQKSDIGNLNHSLWSQRVNIVQHATEYNGKCEDDSECGWLGANSHCKYAHCQCQEKYRWYKGKCISYSDLNERCTVNMDCYDGLTWGSMKCLDNICVCNDGFQNRGNVDCRKISKAEGSCALNIDCPDGYTCQVGLCKKPTKSLNTMLASFQPRENTHAMNSAKDSAHDFSVQPCEVDSDCELDNSECYNATKTCVCSPGYFPHNNTCEGELGVKTCASDKDCYILQGICQNVEGTKQCRCRDYWFYDEDNRKCTKTMSETNWNCLSNEWCYALGIDSYCSSGGVCKCSTLATLNKTDMVCKKQRDSTLCKSDQECSYVKPHSTCVDETCVCENNYRDKNGVCIAALGGTCTTSADCSSVEHAVCNDNTCTCQEGYVESESDDTLCLKVAGMGDECQEDDQCNRETPNAVCSRKGVCECNVSFRYINSACEITRSFQDYCTDAKQCRLDNEELSCRNSKCQCPTKKRLIDKQCVESSSMNFRPCVILLILVGIRRLGVVF